MNCFGHQAILTQPACQVLSGTKPIHQMIQDLKKSEQDFNEGQVVISVII